MKTENKLKIGIVVTAILMNALIWTSKMFNVADITKKGFQYHFEMLILSMWPLFCYVIAKRFKFGEKIGFKPFAVDYIIHSVITFGLIWLFEELIFKYKYVSADVTAEIYMYVISAITFLLYNIKVKKVKPNKRDIMFFVAITAIITVLWFCTQERIVSIVESLNCGKNDIDLDGEFLNWFSHRYSMLKASVSGDFSTVNVYRVEPMMKGCSLIRFASEHGWYIPIAVLVLCAVMISLAVAYSRNTANALAAVITIGFIMKFVIGLTANLFLIYSTSVGIPFLRNIYDIISLVVLLFTFSKKDSDLKTQNKAVLE